MKKEKRRIREEGEVRESKRKKEGETEEENQRARTYILKTSNPLKN